MVGAVTSKPTTGIKFDNVTVGGNITDNHTGPKSGSANARVGGLIAEIGSDISSSPNIVKIQSVSVNTPLKSAEAQAVGLLVTTGIMLK